MLNLCFKKPIYIEVSNKTTKTVCFDFARITMSESHDNQNLCTMNDEISIVNNLLSVVTLTSPDDSHLALPPLPTLPLDLVEQIICRLSVKLLCQLRCVCKSWNSLILDKKFAKKHLCRSTMRRINFLSCSTRRIRSCVSHPPNNLLTSYPLDSFSPTR
jgi:hypothetical protein